MTVTFASPLAAAAAAEIARRVPTVDTFDTSVATSRGEAVETNALSEALVAMTNETADRGGRRAARSSGGGRRRRADA